MATRASRPISSASFDPTSDIDSMWRFGMISTCVGACGLTSRKAVTSGPLYSILAGIAPTAMSQNTQATRHLLERYYLMAHYRLTDVSTIAKDFRLEAAGIGAENGTGAASVPAT